MAKIIDITDKLNFEEKPKLVIRDVEIEINNKAVDLLRVTPELQKKKFSPDDLFSIYKILFPKESQKKIDALNLDINDFTTVIFTAVEMLGTSGDEGEVQTPTTT